MNLFSRFKDLTTIGVANVISSSISGIFWFYIAGLLGTHSYGEVSYFIAISGIASTISFLGSGSTLVVYTAKGENIQKPIFLISGISTFITSIVIFFIFNNIGVSLYIIGATIFTLTTSELIGRKIYGTYSKYLITQKILMVCSAISFYYLLGPQGVIVGYGVSFLPYFIRIYKGMKDSKLDFHIVRNKFGFMMNSYALDLSRTFSGNVDKLIVGPMFGFALLGNYQLGVQFLTLLGILPAIVYQYILPHDASGNPNKQLKKLIILVSIGLAIVGITLSPFVLPTLFPKFKEAINVIQIISIAIIPITINNNYISKFLGREKSKVVLCGSLIYVIAQVSSIYILGKSIGINGVAISIVIANVVESVFLIVTDQSQRKNLS